MFTDAQVRGYLDRLSISEEPKTDLKFLSRLQRAHLLTVPYETLDIYHGIEISLAPEDLYRKIVQKRRGGYCFELNEAYLQLLLSLGFCVTRRFARILKGAEGIPEPRHLLPVVHLPEGDYISDVGVAFKSPMEPVRISPEIQNQPEGRYAVREDPAYGLVLCDMSDGTPVDLNTIPAEVSFPVDFQAIHFFCQHSPDSFFHQRLILGLRLPDGVVQMRDHTLTLLKNGEKTVRNVPVPDDPAFLEPYFHISLGGSSL